MQFVLTKHTWQVVEVYHILITEVYDIDDLRIFMRQAAENLVNIGRFTIDGIIHGRRDNLFELFHVSYSFQPFRIISDVFICIISFYDITCRGSSVIVLYISLTAGSLPTKMTVRELRPLERKYFSNLSSQSRLMMRDR